MPGQGQGALLKTITGLSVGTRERVVVVEVGETFRDALRRELMEEGRIEPVGEPALHGIFLNSHVSRRDHVAVYLIRQFRQDRLPEANREIVARQVTENLFDRHLKPLFLG